MIVDWHPGDFGVSGADFASSFGKTAFRVRHLTGRKSFTGVGTHLEIIASTVGGLTAIEVVVLTILGCEPIQRQDAKAVAAMQGRLNRNEGREQKKPVWMFARAYFRRLRIVAAIGNLDFYAERRNPVKRLLDIFIVMLRR